jgi:hypothetical protein
MQFFQREPRELGPRDSTTMTVRCYRVCNLPNPLNTEPVVALVETAAPNAVTGRVAPKSEVEERLGVAPAPTSDGVHGFPRLKASRQSFIPAEFTVSA